VCNLYNITTNQAAIAALFRVMNRYVGNLPPMPGVFPDYPAAVVRNAGAERELTMMRPPVTNIRNTSSPHWRGWLKPESRCLAPANSFSEYAPEPNPATGKKDVVWFALNDDRRCSPLLASGRNSEATVAPSLNRSPDRTTFMASSPPRRTPLSSRSIPRLCP
jgi:putative SOS response-associated peptidase YedK